MYFSGKLEIDPSKITKIEKIKPDKMFAKLVSALTMGLNNKKEEVETYSAIGILNEIYASLRSSSINNIIRLRVNEHDFYLDTQGKKDDLDEAMMEATTKLDPLEAKVFDKILLVLEHDESKLKYLVEIIIKRRHKVGEYPIQIITNGLLAELKAKTGETREQLKERMKFIFASQQDYDEYVRSKKAIFNTFLDNLEHSVRKFIQVDDVKKISSAKVVRPKQKISSKSQINSNIDSDPVYHGYYGMNDFFFYSMIWASSMHMSNIMAYDMMVVDDLGNDVMAIGDEGFDAGMNNAINDEGDFTPPDGGDVDYFGGNEFESEMGDAGIFDSSSMDSGTDYTESDWFSGGDGGGFDFGDFGDFGDI